MITKVIAYAYECEDPIYLDITTDDGQTYTMIRLVHGQLRSDAFLHPTADELQKIRQQPDLTRLVNEAVDNWLEQEVTNLRYMATVAKGQEAQP